MAAEPVMPGGAHGPARHLLEVDDLGVDGLHAVLAMARRDPVDLSHVLAGEGVALLFEKPSNRTRNSSEMATVALGGHPVYIQGTRSASMSVSRPPTWPAPWPATTRCCVPGWSITPPW